MRRIVTTRRLIVAAALLATYAVLGFWVLPWWARPELERVLGERLAREVSIQTLRVNPFTLRAEIEGLAISAADGPAAQIEIARVVADYQIRSLFSGVHTLREIEVHGLKLAVAVDASGNHDLPVPVPADTAPEPSTEAEPLQFRIEHLSLGDAAVAVRDQWQADAAQWSAESINAQLWNFGTEAESSGAFELGLTLQQARIQASGALGLAARALDLRFILDGFPLTAVQPYLQRHARAELREGALGLELVASLAWLEGEPLRSDVLVQRVGLDGLQLGHSSLDTELAAIERLGLSGLSISGHERRIWLDRMELVGGKLSLALNPEGRVNLQDLARAQPGTDSPPATEDAAPGADSSRWSLGLGELAIDTLDWRFDDQRLPDAVSFTGQLERLRLGPVRNERESESQLQLSLDIGEAGHVDVNGQARLLAGDAELELEASSLALTSLQPYVAQNLRVLVDGGLAGAKGSLQLAAEGESPRLRFKGSASLQDLRSRDALRKRDLLNIAKLDAADMNVELMPARASVETLRAEGLYTRIVVQSDRSVNLAQLVIKEDGAAQTPAPETAPVPLRIGRVELADSRVRFADFSLTPRFLTEIEQFEGSIEGLSSSVDSRAKVDFTGQVDAYAPVTVRGEINLLSEQLSLDLALAFRNVELSSLTPYSGKFAGYTIEKGKLNLDLGYRVEKRELRGENKVVLDQFELGEKTGSPDAIDLPLQLAIALLKDRNGRIDLDVPVRGSLDDPEFSVGRIVMRAFLNLIRKIITAPFALLGSLFGGGDGEELSQLNFGEADASLRESESEKLKAIAKALFERPGLRLDIRGTAEPQRDRERLRRNAFDAALAAEQSAAPERSADETLLALHAARTGTPAAAPPAPAAEDADEAMRSAQDAALQEWRAELMRTVLGSFEVSDEDLLELAAARAQAIKSVVLAPREEGNVDPAQVYLLQPELRPQAEGDDIVIELELGGR